MRTKSTTGIAHLAYELPKARRSLDELSAENLVRTEPDTLREFGFLQSYVAQSQDELFDLEMRVGRQLLKAIEGATDQIETVIVYHGIEQRVAAETKSPLAVFSYTTSHLQYDLGLATTPFVTLSQQGCNGLLSALWLGQRLLATSDKRYVLVICGDRLYDNSPREIIHNIMSDSAGGVVLDTEARSMRLLAHRVIDQPYYWNTPERELEVLAAYFPMAKKVVEELLAQQGLTADDLRWVVPHNVSRRSWEILANILQIPLEKVWLDNVSRTGHTVSTDHVINLHDMDTQALLHPGDKLLLVSFGFGASWAAQLIEY